MPIFVGGFVRDQLLGTNSKDIDIEVFGLSAKDLCCVLEPFGKVSLVGESFGIIKLRTENQDFVSPYPGERAKAAGDIKDFRLSQILR